jgi:hypothetical protein
VEKRYHSDTGALLSAVPFLALCVVAAFAGIAGASSTRHWTPGTPRGSRQLPRCAQSQLRFTYFGESGSMGKGTVGLRVVDASKDACELDGYPSIKFFTGSIASPNPLAAAVGHVGTGEPYAKSPVPVTLEPLGAPGAGTGGGLIWTDADFGNAVAPICHEVTSVIVTLSGTTTGPRVLLWYPDNECDSPPAIETSAFFAGADLGNWVPVSLAPPCVASILSITRGRTAGGLSHLGTALLFKNVGVLPCRLRGFPTVVAEGRGGSGPLVATQTIEGYLGGLRPPLVTPPIVTLESGSTASALIEYTDEDGVCPSYRELLVTPPAVAGTKRIETNWDACSAFEVHPIVPGDSGSAT